MNEQELMALRQRAMRAAEAYGCHAGIEVADFLDSANDPPGSLHLKLVVARRSASGELLSHESNVLLGAGDLAASVEQIVRQTAAELAKLSADDGSPPSAEPNYRKLAGEVRTLIASGAFHTPAAIDDLQQLAASYDALAEHGAHRRKANDPTGLVPTPPSQATGRKMQ
jgi:hypothetical protein